MQDKTPRKLLRSTKTQIAMLVDYMSTHPHLANGEFTGPLGARRMEDEWLKVKSLLREYGPDKSVKQWILTWRDLKKKAREDNARAAQGRASTGNNRTVPEVPENSLKILNTIGFECSIGSGAEESPIGHVPLNPTLRLTSLPTFNFAPPAPSFSNQHAFPTVPTTSTVTSQSAPYTQGQACDEVFYVSHPDPPTIPTDSLTDRQDPESPSFENINHADVRSRTEPSPQDQDHGVVCDSRTPRSSRARGVGHGGGHGGGRGGSHGGGRAVVPNDFTALQQEANQLQRATNNLLEGISSALSERNALIREQNSILLQRNRILKRNR